MKSKSSKISYPNSRMCCGAPKATSVCDCLFTKDRQLGRPLFGGMAPQTNPWKTKTL